MSLRKPVLSNAALEGLAPVLDDTRKAIIDIIKPNQTTGEFDFETGEYVGGDPEIILADVRARIQPVRAAVRRDVTGNETTVKAVLVTIGFQYNTLNITTDMKVVIKSTDLPTALPAYEFYVNDYANSSNPLERAFYCTLNQEVQNVQQP